MPEPLIGIVTAREASKYYPFIYVSYPTDPQAVHQAGGAPLLIPPLISETVAENLVARLDGLYLAGGGDVSARFSPGVDPTLLEGPDEERDRVELALLRAALSLDKPVLAICRGTQFLNIAHGGTLVDDISTRLPVAIKHKVEEGEALDASAHRVHLPPHSLLSQIFGKSYLQVNSFHHQAISTLGNGLLATAFAPDGVIEAVENPAYRFCLGVQWHPEESVGCEPGMEKIFSAFINACIARCLIS